MPILDFRKPALSYGFADPKEDERAARVLAAAPVLLAGALVAIYIDPIEPRATPFSRAYTFLFALGPRAGTVEGRCAMKARVLRGD